MTWIELIDKLSPLIGVLIGGVIGLLSPWVSNKIDRRKRKYAIKYELIGAIYSLYKLLQLHSSNSNLYWFYHQRLELYRKTGLNHPTIPRDEIEVARLNASMDIHFKEMVELEAKVITLKVEVSDFFSKKCFENVSALVESAIDKLNNGDYKLFDYPTLNLAQLESIVPQFEKTRDSQIKMIHQDADFLIKQIQVILK